MENFDLDAAVEEVTSEIDGEPTGTATLDDGGEGQPEGDLEGTEENQELSAQEILEGVDDSPEVEGAEELLEQINAIGAIHSGQPITVRSADELKELLQKGYDYTQKTMAHSEEVRSKEEEFSKRESEYTEKFNALETKEAELTTTINENVLMENVLNKIKADDPDLFQEIARLYQEEEKAVNAHKPFQKQFNNEINKLTEVVKELKSETKQKELEEVRGGWEKDLEETQGKHAAKLAKLGLKVDWEKVKEVWAGDASGKMSVESALFASYGKEIQAAHSSQQNVLKAKAKKQGNLLRRTGAQGAGRTGESVKAQVAGDYDSILESGLATI